MFNSASINIDVIEAVANLVNFNFVPSPQLKLLQFRSGQKKTAKNFHLIIVKKMHLVFRQIA